MSGMGGMAGLAGMAVGSSPSRMIYLGLDCVGCDTRCVSASIVFLMVARHGGSPEYVWESRDVCDHTGSLIDTVVTEEEVN